MQICIFGIEILLEPHLGLPHAVPTHFIPVTLLLTKHSIRCRPQPTLLANVTARISIVAIYHGTRRFMCVGIIYRIFRTILVVFALRYVNRYRAQYAVSARTIVFESDPSSPLLPLPSLFSLFYFGYFIFISPQLTRLVKRLLFPSLLKGLVAKYKCSNECMFSL
jgi:hypothetical protein